MNCFFWRLFDCEAERMVVIADIVENIAREPFRMKNAGMENLCDRLDEHTSSWRWRSTQRVGILRGLWDETIWRYQTGTLIIIMYTCIQYFLRTYTYIYIYINTWNLFVLYFWASTLQNEALSCPFQQKQGSFGFQVIYIYIHMQHYIIHYSHRQNYRKKKMVKCPGTTRATPQMIKEKYAYWCPGNLSLPG